MNSATRPIPGPRPVRRALVVDDDQFMLTVVADMLGELGIGEVSTAGDGAAAIAAFDRCILRPDLILCDLNMPVNDGFQLLEQLGTRGFTGGVILFSGMDDRTLKSASLMARFHRLQFLDTLKKPVDKSALRAALTKLV